MLGSLNFLKVNKNTKKHFEKSLLSILSCTYLLNLSNDSWCVPLCSMRQLLGQSNLVRLSHQPYNQIGTYNLIVNLCWRAVFRIRIQVDPDSNRQSGSGFGIRIQILQLKFSFFKTVEGCTDRLGYQ